MSSKYQMWMTYNGGTEKLRFPVLPETLNIQKGSQNKSVDIQGLGEVVIKQDPAAIVISFSSFFPAHPFPGIQFGAAPAPYDLKDKLTIWQRGDKPVHFLVTGTTVNLYCVIDDFSYYEQGGDIGTLYYTLSLKEYKEVQARQVKVDTAAQKAVLPPVAAARTDNRVPPVTYDVGAGDCMYNIAADLLGDGRRHTEIAELNADTVASPNLVHMGHVLRIPS